MGRRKISTLFSLVCLIITGVLLLVTISFDHVFNHVMKSSFCYPKLFKDSDSFNFSEPGCILPYVDPFDPAILPYLKNISLNCQQSSPLTAIKDDRLILTFPDSKFNSSIGPVDCYYSWLYRAGSDEAVKYGPTKLLVNKDNNKIKGVQFEKDVTVVNTSCLVRNTREIIYRNVHFRVPHFKPPQSNPSSIHLTPPSSSSPLDADLKPSVLILVIESLSRLSFQRFMSSTEKALHRIGKFNHLTALNRVEENSFPNSMALLTGLAVTDSAASKLHGIHWDHRLPFIWETYSSKGYVTAFIEDQPMAGLFSYYNRGFTNPPTDFYPVHFWSHMYPKGRSNMIDLLVNPVNYCFEKVGAKVNIYLEMCKQFVEKVLLVQSNPYFLYAFYSQMTHEDFNNFQLVDQPVAQFLLSLSQPILNNSFVILIGDHGPRVAKVTPEGGDPTNSPMGRLEGSLPFFAMRIPDSLDSRYPHLRKYLSLNSERLSSWFDINQMLGEIAQGNFHPISRRSQIPVAYSLFREEVPITRTCKQANISPVFCACNGRVGIYPPLKSHHIDAAKGMVEALRSVFLKHKCRHRITYRSTLSGEYFYPRSNETWSTFERVKLSITVLPTYAVINGQVYRSRKSTKLRWSPWNFYDPEGKLKSSQYTQQLTNLLCVKHSLRNINTTIV